MTVTDRKLKGPKKLERHFKGVANHRRIHMLMLIAKDPGVTLDMLVERLNGNTKTLAEHSRRLVLAGLVEKRYKGREVEHHLTPYGRIFIDFIETFSHS